MDWGLADMSRNVNLDEPLSDRDRQYLEVRSKFHDIAKSDGTSIRTVIANLNNYGTSAGRGPVEAIDEDADSKGGRQDDDSTEAWVESLTVDQLKEEITKRDPEASTAGKKAELQDTLLDILAEEEED